MIIKRNLKSQMPSLKRCKLADSVEEDNECSNIAPKKRKTSGYYYPLDLLGDVAAALIPASFHGLLSS
ncbi:histone-lysine N-methyltransferase ATX5-like, partial [Trifolium medium]|nr:histone-lysine N-methyltransferase ATX5-like [Trifolium medium]